MANNEHTNNYVHMKTMKKVKQFTCLPCKFHKHFGESLLVADGQAGILNLVFAMEEKEGGGGGEERGREKEKKKQKKKKKRRAAAATAAATPPPLTTTAT